MVGSIFSSGAVTWIFAISKTRWFPRRGPRPKGVQRSEPSVRECLTHVQVFVGLHALFMHSVEKIASSNLVCFSPGAQLLADDPLGTLRWEESFDPC